MTAGVADAGNLFGKKTAAVTPFVSVLSDINYAMIITSFGKRNSQEGREGLRKKSILQLQVQNIIMDRNILNRRWK